MPRPDQAASDRTAGSVCDAMRMVRRHDEVQIRFTAQERDLIVDETFADDDVVEKLRSAMVEPDGEIVIQCTPDALDDLLAAIAAAANHCESRKLERRLDKLYDRLDAFERTLLIVGE